MSLLTQEESQLGYTARGWSWAYRVIFPPKRDYLFVLGSMDWGLTFMKDGSTWTLRLLRHGLMYVPGVMTPRGRIPLIVF